MVPPGVQRLLRSNLVLGVAAATAGVIAAWLGTRYLQDQAGALERQNRQRYSPAAYVVASRDVERGQQIDPSLLAIRSIPKAFAPTDALAPEAAGLLIGGRAAIAIRRGTPVVRAAVAPEAHHTRLSEQLPEGMRALTIQVDQVNSVSGHLEAGDWVDLYYSRTRGSGAILVPLMQRLQVLAAGDETLSRDPLRADGDAREFSSITLLVTADAAQRIVLAEQTGRITVLLRRPGDAHQVDTRPFDSANLFTPAGSARSRDRSQVHPIELLVGGNGGSPSRSWLVPGGGA